MNPGGIGADISINANGIDKNGEFTFGEAFGTRPFGNSLVTMTLTGAQIDAVLEQQFGNPEPGRDRILQVSAGFAYSWSAAAPVSERVDASTITINGEPISADATYRVTVNSFLADGGDNFSVLRSGTDRLGDEVDLDALVIYFGENSPIAPGPQNRITRTG
ncbi:MAG: 5'-nucleotidase C-terminal domain-containing protein [Acidimicrobiales bacterium]|jgi:5'-nucleotidase